MQKECHSLVPREYEADDRGTSILLSIDMLSSSAFRAVLEGQRTTTSRASPLNLCPATPLSLKVRWLFHSDGVVDITGTEVTKALAETPHALSARALRMIAGLAALVLHAGD